MKLVKLSLLVVTTALLGSLPALGRPFTPRDLVILSHIGHPAVSSDGRWLVWDQGEADMAANSRRRELWRLDLSGGKALPQKLAAMRGSGAGAPVFGPDGRLYFLSELADGNTAVWSIAATGGSPTQVTGDYDLSGFKLSPRGNAILVWADRPVGARSLAEVAPAPARNRGNVRVYETDELWPDRWDHGGKLYFEAPAAYERWNPANAVAAWDTPQLVITGEKDFRSPSTQAVAAFTALQLRGVASRLLVFPDEGHWVQKPEDALRWYDEVLHWMDSWTAGAARPAGAISTEIWRARRDSNSRPHGS